jgi:hypothetical protein
MGSSAPSNTTSTTTAQPWSGQQPYLSDMMSQAAYLYNTDTPQYYPTSTVAQMNQPETSALGAQYNYGMNGGDPSLIAANGSNAAISSGYFLNNQNPQLQQVEQQADAAALPAIQSQFIAGGGLNGGLAAQASAQGLANANANIGYQNYNDQIQNMEKANFTAPMIDSAQGTDLQNAQNFGSALQNQDQQNITADVNRWNYNQNLPYNMLGMFDNFIQGSYGGSTATSTPNYKNPLASGLSGAAGGAALGTEIDPGYGTAIGAVAGGLAGWLG